MKHTTEKITAITLLLILFTASNLFALAPKPKPESLPELYRVLKVINGDIIDILFHRKKERIRLLRIDTLERDKWGYFKARKALKNLVGGRKVRGLTLRFPGKWNVVDLVEFWPMSGLRICI